jgi:hypothetical protein
MTLDEIEDTICRLRIQNMVLRDYVIWLLAREIGSALDPEATIRLADEFGKRRIASLASESQADLLTSELFQQEKDLLIAAASKVLMRD